MQKKNTPWLTILALSLSVPLSGSALAQGAGSPTQNPSSPASSGSSSMQPSEQIGNAIGDKAATDADRSLNQRIRQALNADTALAAVVQKVYLDTNNGAVTLQGSVPTEKIKDDVGAKVQQVAGVKEVENQLQMAPN